MDYSPHEIEFATRYIGLFKRCKSKGMANCDVLIKSRKISSLNPHEQLIKKWDVNYDSSDSYCELLFLCFKNEDEVWSFVKRSSLSQNYIYQPFCANVCTWIKYNGAPLIKKLCDNRFVLRYYWNMMCR